MPSQTAHRRYASQRPTKTPPHLSIGIFRKALKLTLEDVADRVEEITGDRPTKGALSAIENGHRGVSAELLEALEKAYDIPAGSISTDYEPRAAAQVAAAGSEGLPATA